MNNYIPQGQTLSALLWKLQQDQGQDPGQDPNMLASLIGQPQEQLAQLGGGMGMSPAHYAAQEAARQAAVPPPPGAWGQGGDGQVTQDWKARQAAGQAAERDRLIRMQQERARGLRQGG